MHRFYHHSQLLVWLLHNWRVAERVTPVPLGVWPRVFVSLSHVIQGSDFAGVRQRVSAVSLFVVGWAWQGWTEWGRRKSRRWEMSSRWWEWMGLSDYLVVVEWLPSGVAESWMDSSWESQAPLNYREPSLVWWAAPLTGSPAALYRDEREREKEWRGCSLGRVACFNRIQRPHDKVQIP